jgi:hypothetical protein
MFPTVEVGEAGSLMDASSRKAREVSPGSPIEAERRDHSMIQLLVKPVLPLFGQLTVLFVWKRKRHK